MGSLSGFGSLMNIDKLILIFGINTGYRCFGSLMNIDKLILVSSLLI